MDVLFLTTVLPAGGRGGGEIVSQNILDAVTASGRDVHVLGYLRPADRPAGRGEQCVGRRPIETSSARLRAIAWMVRALVGHNAYSTTKFRSRAYRKAAERAVARRPAIVIVDHAQACFDAATLSTSDPPFIFVAHNVERDAYARLAGSTRHPISRWVHARESRLISDRELLFASRARQIWTLTDSDREHFRWLCPSSDVRTLEVPSSLTGSSVQAPAFDVGLIGTWSWRPNDRGLRWFESEVVPRLPDGMTVEIAGRGAEWLRGRYPNVTVRGRVPDAQGFLAHARVVAIPAISGSGVQVKTLDAIASGLPVVATPLAMRGIAEPPESVSVADSGAAFARELVALAKDAHERADVMAEAVGWSAARRQRFEASVTGWVREAMKD